MLLVIDIGNSSIDIGLYKNNQFLDRLSIGHKHSFEEEKINSAIKNIEPKSCVISSVADELTDKMREFVINKYKIEPVIISSKLKLDINLKVNHPDTIGADRLANIYASSKIYSVRPLIVIDSGSATTFDVLDKNGDFIGGVIMPGFGLQFKSMHEHTSKLPLVNVKKIGAYPCVINDETEDEMAAGVIRGHICSIEGLLKRCEKELSAKPFVVLTGGCAGIIQKYMQKELYDAVNPNLTLEGIRMLYEYNKG